MKQKKIVLDESQIPTSWYNIQADMPNPLLPPLHPGTKQPVGPQDLMPLFPMELIKQEVSKERWIEIPERVRDEYKAWRCTPLYRAYDLEKALDTDCPIYYKYEGVSPSGSHKSNTAMAQVYYNQQEGVKKITTETGAGQWGTALSHACSKFGLDCEVYMVKGSYSQKPYRKIVMNTYGATVFPSPSTHTKIGASLLEKHPDTTGSLGIAISEAIEQAMGTETTKYALGSVLNHVLMHQSVIGLEAYKQMELAGHYPDIIIAPLGGGSNFAGISFPFLHYNLTQGKTTRCIAVEPASCPKLTKGQFRYDFGDMAGFTPLIPMYTLGHNFLPSNIHAGGLRYHGASALCSQLLKDKLIEASAIAQIECFEAGVLFSRTENIIPAPEATHAIAQVIREVKKAKQEGRKKTILFNLCGHGMLDLQAYDDYFNHKIQDHFLPDEEIQKNIAAIEGFPPIPNQ